MEGALALRSPGTVRDLLEPGLVLLQPHLGVKQGRRGGRGGFLGPLLPRDDHLERLLPGGGLAGRERVQQRGDPLPLHVCRQRGDPGVVLGDPELGLRGDLLGFGEVSLGLGGRLGQGDLVLEGGADPLVLGLGDRQLAEGVLVRLPGGALRQLDLGQLPARLVNLGPRVLPAEELLLSGDAAELLDLQVRDAQRGASVDGGSR